VNQHDVIAGADVAINRMAHHHRRAKSMHDGAWGQFTAPLSIKAAWAGRKDGAVNPADTSHNCSGCGHRKSALTRGDRGYPGAWCGLMMDRDRNASKTMLALGRQCLGWSQAAPGL
jgi:putative transposase